MLHFLLIFVFPVSRFILYESFNDSCAGNIVYKNISIQKYFYHSFWESSNLMLITGCTGLSILLCYKVFQKINAVSIRIECFSIIKCQLLHLRKFGYYQNCKQVCYMKLFSLLYRAYPREGGKRVLSGLCAFKKVEKIPQKTILGPLLWSFYT